MKLEAFGIDSQDRVLTSAMAAASLVDAGERVLVCAGEGVVEAVASRGAYHFPRKMQRLPTNQSML